MLMQDFLFFIHIFSAIMLIILVIPQHGKNADSGTAFSNGASGTMFGSVGSISFMVKLTGIVAIVFFTTSILFGVIEAKNEKKVPASLLISTKIK